MTDTGPADTAAPEVQRAQTRLALGALLVPVFFVSMFALCIIGTYHTPHPNGIKLGVVGPAANTAQVRGGLEKAGRSSVDVSQVETVADATYAVRRRALNAALVPGADRKQPATVIVASAGGRLVAKATEDFVRAATADHGARLVVRDVRPLAAGDPLGLGVFMFMIVCTIGGSLAVTLLGTVAPDLAPSRRYPMIAATAVLVPAIVYLIGGLGFGTYTGSVGTILAFIGVGALYTFVIGLVTRLLQVLLGRPRSSWPSPSSCSSTFRASGPPIPPRCSSRSGASSTTSGSERRPSTSSAASCTSTGWASARTCSGFSPGRV